MREMNNGTAFFRPVISDAKLIVVERGAVNEIRLSSRPRWKMGRFCPGNAPDIPLHSAIVSRQHGEFLSINGEWFYSYSGSANATFYNGRLLRQGAGGRPTAVPLQNGDVLRVDFNNLDTPDANGVLLLFSTDEFGGEWSYFDLRGRRSVLIGRDPRKCDIAQPMPYVSARHAKIENTGRDYYLSDCGSSAGTWMNGRRVERPVRLREKDQFSICDRHFIFTGSGLLYSRCAVTGTLSGGTMQTTSRTGTRRPYILHANIRRKVVPDQSGHGKKELIRDVRLSIRRGSLVALLGGSGAGKSTVMNCLNGMDQQGVEGEVLFLGENLYRNFDRVKYLIGSVPQKNEIHEMLSVEEELREAAGIRMPADTTRREIASRIDHTLRMLNLEAKRKTQIRKLSGGEQKRVNIGVELVADRLLLCLDEPDAGLDPATKKELFSILKRLATENDKCILVIIHDVAEIDMFDQVLMMAKVHDVGRLAFFGTPREATEYFGVRNLKDAYEKLAASPERYIRSNG